jgi:hypothetical membrane protein
MEQDAGEGSINRKIVPWIKLGGICGIVAPLIALTCIGIASGLTPWFSWTDNFLSELAGPANSRNIAFPIFNAGLIVAGLLGMFFGWALWESRTMKNNLGKFAAVLLVVDMAFLWGIGVFPMASGALHGISATSFFVLLPIVQLLIGISLYASSEKRIGLIMFLMAIVSFMAFPLFFIPPPVGSNGIAEIIPAISLAISSLVLGLHVFKYLERIQKRPGYETREAERDTDREEFA